MDQDRAEIIAINSLSFIASDEKLFSSYLSLSGLDIKTLRDDMANPEKMNDVLAGILDYLMGDERLLIEFAENYTINPNDIGRARQHFPGAPLE